MPRLQLWLLAEWVVSEGGRTVRRPLAQELVRLVDAVISSESSSSCPLVSWQSWGRAFSHSRGVVQFVVAICGFALAGQCVA